METDLFSWENISFNEMLVSYDTCTLEINIGDFLAGKKIPLITIDYDSGTLMLFANDNQLMSKHHLKLVLNGN